MALNLALLLEILTLRLTFEYGTLEQTSLEKYWTYRRWDGIVTPFRSFVRFSSYHANASSADFLIPLNTKYAQIMVPEMKKIWVSFLALQISKQDHSVPWYLWTFAQNVEHISYRFCPFQLYSARLQHWTNLPWATYQHHCKIVVLTQSLEGYDHRTDKQLLSVMRNSIFYIFYADK